LCISFFVFRRIAAGMSVYSYVQIRSTIKITFYTFFIKCKRKQTVKHTVISAQAGIHADTEQVALWIPACAGITP
jgi:hypothetical protein